MTDQRLDQAQNLSLWRPILFSRKKDRILRMCIDYGALNQQRRPNEYPLPRINDLLDQLVFKNYLSSIELDTGNHQVEICPGNEYKKAFFSRYGLFEFFMLPFGLMNYSSKLLRLLNNVFDNIIDKYI